MIQVGGEQGWGKNVTERQQKEERRGQYNHMYLCTYENGVMKLITCLWGVHVCGIVHMYGGQELTLHVFLDFPPPFESI